MLQPKSPVEQNLHRAPRKLGAHARQGGGPVLEPRHQAHLEERPVFSHVPAPSDAEAAVQVRHRRLGGQVLPGHGPDLGGVPVQQQPALADEQHP